MKNEPIHEIEPALLSHDECKFLIDNVGTVSVVALKNVPPGVNPLAVKPILDRVTELQNLEKYEGEKWVGLDRIKEGLQVYLDDRARCEAVAARVGKGQKMVATFPSMFTFDAKGRPNYYAAGSDSSYPRTYFDPVTKQRRLLVIPLVPSSDEWVPPWLEGVKEAPKDLLEDTEKLRVECRICGHAESYREGSAASERAARARMAAHMKRADFEPELHREYYTNVYGG